MVHGLLPFHKTLSRYMRNTDSEERVLLTDEGQRTLDHYCTELIISKHLFGEY